MSQVFIPSTAGGSSPTFTNVTATGQFLAANGTVAAPSYSFTNGTNSGLYYFAGNNEVDVSANGNQVFRFLGTQNISNVQLTAPVFLAANGSAAAPSYSFTNSTNSGMYLSSAGNVGFSASGTEVAAYNNFAFSIFLETALQGLVVLSEGWQLTYTATAVNLLATVNMIIIGVTSTAAARTITLPASPTGAAQRMTIKDESGAAGTNNITVSGNGANIDGAATKIINTNYGSIDIYFNGTNWFTI